MNLEYSSCVLCGKDIHRNPSSPAPAHMWFDSHGMLCVTTPSGKVNHIPAAKEGNMPFPENKIREACRKSGIGPVREEELLKELKRERDDTVIEDSAIFTAKEIREAQSRLRKPGFPSQVIELGDLLKDILDHREPVYPYTSVWEDFNGMHWLRGTGSTWQRFGDACTYGDSKPVRPLRRMILSD